MISWPLAVKISLALAAALFLFTRRWERGSLLYARANRLYVRGKTAQARVLFRQLREQHPSSDSVNSDVCLSIAGGRYREALRTTLTTPEEHRSSLLYVNQAEALYCMGRWARAERVVRAIVKERRAYDLVSRYGTELQLAWILAATGRGAEARALAENADVTKLPREYRAEGHFTRAVAALADGDAPAAERHLEASKPHLIRMGSKRNALFLRARVHAALNQPAQALELARQGAEHSYRFQGGDGLLLYGDLLDAAGRPDEARALWARCLTQDPESEAARLAAAKLSTRTRSHR